MTKWVETTAIKAATEEKVAKFVRENVFYKFGYLKELVTDQGSQFTSNMIKDLLSHHRSSIGPPLPIIHKLMGKWR